MLKGLVKLANRLDSLGLTKEADVIDREILKLASKKSSSPDPRDEDISVENLEKIIALDPYERWHYMTKADGKNNDFLQSAAPTSPKQIELLNKVIELCEEDFMREAEFEEIWEAERNREPAPNSAELFEIIEKMKEEDTGEGDTLIPDYGGRGVSVFRDPNAPLGGLSSDERKKMSIKVHKKPTLRDENISVKDLPESLKKKRDTSTGGKGPEMSEEELQSFRDYLDRISGGGDKLMSGKRKHSEKVKKIDELKEKLRALREELEEEEDSEQKDQISAQLDKTVSKLNELLRGTSVSTMVESEDEGEVISKPLSEYTLSDIDLDNFYVFQMMNRPGTKRKFWVAVAEFVEENDADDFAQSLELEAGVREEAGEDKIGMTKVLDGYSAKELLYSGEGRFRVESWAGGKLPTIKRERDGINPRLDPEKQESSGSPGFGGISGFGKRNI